MGVNKLEISPFLAVLRALKIEYGADQQEVYKMLLAILHDYNPSLGKDHITTTIRYISLLLEKHPIYAEYITSVLPKSPDNSAEGFKPHSLHLLRDNFKYGQGELVHGQGDVKVTQDVTGSKLQGEGNMPNPLAKLLRPKAPSPKCYNYTAPSVNAYVASQGIPQKIVSHRASPTRFSTLVTFSTPGLVAPTVHAKSTIRPHTLGQPLGSGPVGPKQGQIKAGPLTAGTVFIRPPGRSQSASSQKGATSSIASHGQTALLLSSSCPTLITPLRTFCQPACSSEPKKSSSSKNLVLNEMRKGTVSSSLATSASMTVSISRSPALKPSSSPVERHANSFPYSQQIVVNSKLGLVGDGQPKIKISKNRSTSQTATVTREPASMTTVSTSGDEVRSDQVATTSKGATTPANQNVDPEPDSTVSETVHHTEPLDLSTRAATPDIFWSAQDDLNKLGKTDGKPFEDNVKHTSELGSQDNCSSQSTDGGDASQPTTATTTTDEVSSDEGNSTPRGFSFLDRILKLPSPPNYSPFMGTAHTKDKRKAKSNRCPNKKKPTSSLKN